MRRVAALVLLVGTACTFAVAATAVHGGLPGSASTMTPCHGPACIPSERTAQCGRHGTPFGPGAPQFHFHDSSCGNNDPNAPLWDPNHQLYHLFYQDHEPGGVVWGHAVSADLIYWAHLPVALWNDKWWDYTAVFSGSATIVDGHVKILYPGLCVTHNETTCPHTDPKASGISINAAVPANASDPFLRSWIKNHVPAMNGTSSDPSTAWRTKTGEWRFTLEDTSVHVSKDFAHWQQATGSSGFWSCDCPDFFELAPILASSSPTGELPPNGPTHAHKCGACIPFAGVGDYYRLGTYDEGADGTTGRFSNTTDPIPTDAFRIGDGSPGSTGPGGGAWNCSVDPANPTVLAVNYAAKSFWDAPHMRRVDWTWLNINNHQPAGMAASAGSMGLPTVLTYEPTLRRLLYNPLPELKQLRTARIGGFSGSQQLPPNPELTSYRSSRNNTIAAATATWVNAPPEALLEQAEYNVVFPLPDMAATAAAGGCVELGIVFSLAGAGLQQHRNISVFFSKCPAGSWTAGVDMTHPGAPPCDKMLMSGRYTCRTTQSFELLPYETTLSFQAFIDHTSLQLWFMSGRVQLSAPFPLDQPIIDVGAYAVGSLGSTSEFSKSMFYISRMDIWGMSSIWISADEVLRRRDTATATRAKLKMDDEGGLSPDGERVATSIEAVLPLLDIGFDTANWSFPSEVKVTRGGPNGTMICIAADPEQYIKANLVIRKPEQHRYFFVADTRLHGIVPGGQTFDCPKLKVNGVEHMNSDYIAQNLQASVDNVWVLAALQVAPSKFTADTHLDVEIGMQQVARGEFCVRSPRLSLAVPPASYSYPFPAPASNLVKVVIDSEDQRPFLKDLLSANSQLTSLDGFRVGYHSPQVQELLRWLHLPTLRFPGGTVGNFYNWRTDTFHKTTGADRGCTAIISERSTSQSPFGFPGFAQAMHATNSSVILMFNVIDDSVSDSVARLKARTQALPRIDWIELGNVWLAFAENYGQSQSCGHINAKSTRPPRAEDYNAFTSAVAAGLRSSGLSRVPPLVAPLSASLSWTAGGWNSVLVNSTVYDGFVMHPYVGVDDAFFTPATAAKMLLASGIMRAKLQLFAQYAGKQRPLLLTEFGILGTTTGTFLQTLGQASMYLGILDLWHRQEVHIVQAGIHILLAGSKTTPSALFAWDPEGNRTVATPTGVVWRKLVQVLKGSAVLGTRSTAPQLPDGTAAVDILTVRQPGRLGGMSLLVVNKLGVPAEIRASSAELGGSQHSVCGVEIFTQPPLSWGSFDLSEVDALWVTHAVNKSRSAEVASVPPLSIAVVQLCHADASPRLKADDVTETVGLPSPRLNSTTVGVTVFTFNEGGWPCTRIPSVILAGNDTLLAFAECRDRTGDGCEPHTPIKPTQPKCVCMKRSSDAGKTWDASPRCVAQAGSSQPLAVFHSSTGTTVLHFNGPNGTVHHISSKDRGTSWSAASSLASVLGPRCATAKAGPGRGLELSGAGPFPRGRLVMVGWHEKFPSPTRHDCIWYSDNAGDDWKLSATTIPLMNEAQVAEIPAGGVYFNSRTRGNITGKPSECRASSISTDGGQHFSLPVQWNPVLTEPGQGCQGSVLGLPVGNPKYLFFSNPGASSRTMMTVRRSEDSGKTWPLSKVVHPGGSAYSCMTNMPAASQLGLLHERDADDGCAGPSCQTVFSILPLTLADGE